MVAGNHHELVRLIDHSRGTSNGARVHFGLVDLRIE